MNSIVDKLAGDFMHFMRDLFSVLRNHDSWLYLAWVDIVLRYKRTVVGPFWMVIVSFVTIVCISVLASLLFKVRVGEMFPYVACGMTTWTFLSMLITDSTTVFLGQIGIIKNINTNIMTFCFRLFIRSLIVYFHSLVVIFVILLFSGVNFAPFFLIGPISLLVYFINTVSLSINLGFLSTRYRDVIHIVTSLMSILAFMTPIMWKPEMLGEYSYLVNYNPFTHFISIIREPLLGRIPEVVSICFVTVFTFFNFATAGIVYGKFHRKLVFWL